MGWRDATPLDASPTPTQGGWKGATPLDQPPPPAPADGSSYDPNWKPSGNSIIDFLMRPRAKDENPIAAAHDAGLSAFDTATFGYGPKMLGLQDQAAKAHENLGLVDYGVSGLTYAAVPGQGLGRIARAGAGLLPEAGAGAGFLARAAPSIVAGAGEGAAAGGLGAAGHGGDTSDIVKGALVNSALGGATGVFGGMGPKPKTPDVGVPRGTDATGVPTAPTGMYAAKEAGYAPLDNLYFDSHGPALDRANTVVNAERNPAGRNVTVKIPDAVNSILTDKQGLANPEVTGRTIQQASRDLRDTGDPIGHRYADQLDNVLRYDKPSFGGDAGDAWKAKTAGDVWHGRIADLNRLSADGGPTPTAVANTRANYADGTPQANSLDALKNASGPGANWWHWRHPLGALAFEGAAQGAEAMDPDRHSPWVHTGLHALAAASLFSGAPAALNAVRGAGQSSALNAAKYAIGTGRPIASTTGDLSNALSNLWFGQGASGGKL